MDLDILAQPAMENTSISASSLPTAFDFQSPTSTMEGKRLGIYAAIAVVLLVAWLLQPSKQTSKIEAPFYKASKTKWIFDAETLIKDSYNKVCSARFHSHLVSVLVLTLLSSKTRSTRSRRLRASKCCYP